jgi:hypothetical protein
MTFNNKGRIRPAAGPEGHTHSIYQLNDVAAAGNDYQTLVSNNGVWVAQTAIPYAIAAGSASIVLTGTAATWSTASTTIDLTVAPYYSPFTLTPVVTASPGPVALTGPMSTQIYSASPTSIVIRLNYYGNLSQTVTVNWIAVQMRSSTNSNGATSADPSIL